MPGPRRFLSADPYSGGQQLTVDDTSNFVPNWQLPPSPPDDMIMAFADDGRSPTPVDPYTQKIKSFRNYIGENYAKPYVGEALAGALLDEDPLLNSHYSSEGKSGMRQAGAIAGSLPVGLALGAGKSLLKGGMRAAASAEPTVAKLLERGGAEFTGEHAVEEAGRFGRSPSMSSIADDVGGPGTPNVGPQFQERVAARAELARQGLPQSEIERIMQHAGEGTILDIPNIRNMGPTDELELLNRLHARGQGVQGVANPNNIPGISQLGRPARPAVSASRAPAIITPRRTGERVSPSGLILPQKPFEPTPGRILSIDPAAWENPDRIPTMEELIGAGYFDEGRPVDVSGITNKTNLQNPLGQRFMWKGGNAGGTGTTAREQIISSSQGHGRRGVIQEEAGSRLANLVNMKTPLAVETVEGGTIQPFVHGSPKQLGMVVNDERYRGAIPAVSLDRADLAHQMQEEQVIDTLGQISDRHEGQFLWDPQTSQMTPVDKGINYLMDYRQGGMRGTQGVPGRYFPGGGGDVADYYSTYGKLKSGGAWNKHLDPEVYQRTIARMKGISEADYRKALTPLKRIENYSGARELTDADFDALMRNFMGEIDTLGPRFENYYNLHKP
jgi:hypothetical protein